MHSALANELVARPLLSEFEAAAQQVELSLIRFEDAFIKLELEKLDLDCLRSVLETRSALAAAAIVVRNVDQ